MRKIQPPQTLMMLLVELVGSEDSVRMNEPGTETTPGSTEQISGFPVMVDDSDFIDASGYMTEQIRTSQIRGKCV